MIPYLSRLSTAASRSDGATTAYQRVGSTAMDDAALIIVDVPSTSIRP